MHYIICLNLVCYDQDCKVIETEMAGQLRLMINDGFMWCLVSNVFIYLANVYSVYLKDFTVLTEEF